MLRRDYLLAAICLILTTCNAVADPPRPEAGSGMPPVDEQQAACTPWEKAVLGLHGSDPASRLVDVADGKEAQELLAFLNAIPPASHVAGDHVAVVFVPAADKYVFIAGVHDCTTAIMEVPRDAIERMAGISI